MQQSTFGIVPVMPNFLNSEPTMSFILQILWCTQAFLFTYSSSSSHWKLSSKRPSSYYFNRTIINKEILLSPSPFFPCLFSSGRSTRAYKVAGLTLLACVLIVGQAMTAYFLLSQKNDIKSLEDQNKKMQTQMTKGSSGENVLLGFQTWQKKKKEASFINNLLSH